MTFGTPQAAGTAYEDSFRWCMSRDTFAQHKKKVDASDLSDTTSQKVTCSCRTDSETTNGH